MALIKKYPSVGTVVCVHASINDVSAQLGTELVKEQFNSIGSEIVSRTYTLDTMLCKWSSVTKELLFILAVL